VLEPFLDITFNEVDLDQIVARITSDTIGAVCIFTGIVRGITTRDEAHSTVCLEYEAYIPMAKEKLVQIAGEIKSRWPEIEGIAIVQRLGKLVPKTSTVVIACSSSHRDTGIFEAARYGIDRLKEIVPTWKKEVSPHGEIWVEGDYIPTRED
jgi:molybdopterin synthase catalytic subunit